MDSAAVKPEGQVKRGRGRPRKNPLPADAPEGQSSTNKKTDPKPKSKLKSINDYFAKISSPELTSTTTAPPPPSQQPQEDEKPEEREEPTASKEKKPAPQKSKRGRGKRSSKKKKDDDDSDYEDEGEEDEPIDSDEVDNEEEEEEVEEQAEVEEEEEEAPAKKRAKTTKKAKKGRASPKTTPKKTRSKYIKIADRRNPDGTPVERSTKSLKIKRSLFTVAARNEDRCKSYWNSDVVYKTFKPPTSDRIVFVPRDVAASYFYSSPDAQPTLKVAYSTIDPNKKVDAPSVASGASERDSTRVGPEDVLINAGGPIRTVDWCPMKYDSEYATQYIATATKSPDVKDHTLNTQCPGCGTVQIWALEGLSGNNSSSSSSSSSDKECLSPSASLELAILHDYGTIFELQWCPTGAFSEGSSEAFGEGRLGLIAAATSSGAVVVWSVPLPSSLRKDSADFTPFVRIEPSFCVSVPGAVPTSIEWSLDAKHSSLLVGFSDGHVRVWAPEECRRECKDGQSNEDCVDDYSPYFECFCGSLGVRSVRWSPLISDVFAAAVLSHLPELQVWSLQNPFSPLQSFIPIGSYIPRAIEWNSLNVVLFGTDNGVMNQIIPLDTTKMRILRNHRSALWGLDFNPFTLQSASVGADGVVMLTRSGQRRDHSQSVVMRLAALSETQDDGVVELRTDESVIKLKESSASSDLSIPRSSSLYSVSWNKLKHTLKWIAFGGENGLLFIHKIKTAENYIV